ncbi:MAG TPA: helix-turn-helix domain-containing protein [Candidatus Saccharimonadales bacterium]
MSQIHQSRKSDNPYIETVWQTRNIADGVYLATPDGSWDLIVGIDETGAKFMLLAGQATKPVRVPYKAGTRSVVISFAPGAYMPYYPANELLDNTIMLTNFDDEHFTLAGHTFAFPTFENAEQLVDKLVKLKILRNDNVVEGELQGTPKAMSARGKQRHFSQTTGMTKKYLDQIKQAQQAVTLLQQGKKPIEAAMEAGYTDQPHLAKSLRKIMNTKPSDVDDIHKL